MTPTCPDNTARLRALSAAYGDLANDADNFELVVRYEADDGRFTYENIAIHEGWALWQGKEYRT